MTTAAVGDAPAGSTDTFEIARAAIARIVVTAGTQIVSRGTGTLITPNLVLSALHVVANRRTDPPQPYPGELTLEFPGFTTKGKILDGAWDRTADWVLIECAEAPPVTPMPMASMTENKRTWESFGFPDANSRDGLLLTGNVLMCEGRLEGTRAHQLFCTQAAAGSGGRVKGMSGAPVVVGGMLVGVMRFALMEDDRTEMGTLYACPVSAVAERWPTLVVAPLAKKRVPPRLTAQIAAATAARAGWELGAFGGALAIVATAVFALSRIHVGATEIDADVGTSDVQFTLAGADQLRLYSANMLQVTAVSASGLESVTVPGAHGGRTSIDASSAQIELAADGIASSQLAIDLAHALPAGTKVLLHHADGLRYRLVIDSLAEPIGLQFEGNARVSAGGQTVALHSGDADSVTLKSVGRAGLIIEFDLEPKAVVKLGAPVKARNVSYFEKYLGENNQWTLRPAITTGSIRLDTPRGEVVSLRAADSLAVIPDSVVIKQLTFPNDSGGLSVHFTGAVSRLLVGSAGATRDLMPTWLDRLRSVYALPSSAAAAALVVLMAYLMVRWRRRIA